MCVCVCVCEIPKINFALFTAGGLEAKERGNGSNGDGSSNKVRFMKLSMSSSLSRLERLDMLLDMPHVPREIEVEHSWNPDDSSRNIFVKEDDETTFHRYPVAQSTDCIRSRIGYTRGLHVWEITWSTRQRGTNAVVGVATPDAPLHSVGYRCLVGSNVHSWGWDLGRNKLYHNNSNTDNAGVTYPKLLNSNETFSAPDKFLSE